MVKQTTIPISDLLSKDVFNRLLNLKVEIKWNFNTTKARDKFEYVVRRFIYGCANALNDATIDVIEYAYTKHKGFKRSPYTIQKYQEQGYEITAGMIKTGATLAHLKKLRESAVGRESWTVSDTYVKKDGSMVTEIHYADAEKKVKVGSMAEGRLYMDGEAEFSFNGYPFYSGKPIAANVLLLMLNKRRWLGKTWREAMKGYRYKEPEIRRYAHKLAKAPWRPDPDIGGKIPTKYMKQGRVGTKATMQERLKQKAAHQAALQTQYELKTEELLYLKLQSEKRGKRKESENK